MYFNEAKNCLPREFKSNLNLFNSKILYKKQEI